MQGDPFGQMWDEACARLERAERLQQQFFRRACTAMRRSNWQPPIDIIENATRVLIEVALPGVDVVQVILDGGALIVSGERPLPDIARAGGIRRLEIPHGVFERRIDLPPGHYELHQQELRNGCLTMVLFKLH